MSTTGIPYLLGGKTLQGVQLPPLPSPSPSPPSAAPSAAPSHSQCKSAMPHGRPWLVDIESCVDDPTVAPLGSHVKSRTPSEQTDSTGEVRIQKKYASKDVLSKGFLLLRRRGMESEELASHLANLLPPLAHVLKHPQSRFQSLVELDISRNHLTQLPDNIAMLKHLRILNVSSNRLTTIPEVLFHLTHLESLNLSQNQLTTLPAEMPARLPHLVSLHVAANRIEHVTPAISQWSAMRHLQFGSVFGGNRLTWLPDEVADMASLEELDLSHNQLRALPANMAIPTLTHLNVADNQLDALPKSIAHCRRLRTLNVSKNHLTTLPADLVELQRLELFDVSENLLCIIPADILERMRTTLLITGNPLTRPGHCDLANSDPYSKILQQMTLRALPTTRFLRGGDRCGPHGMGCESPFASSSSSSPLPIRPHYPSASSSPTLSPTPHFVNHALDLDSDASIDHQLSYHARQLNIRGSLPGTPGSMTGTISPLSAPATILDPTTDDAPPPALVHSLREIASRAILRHGTEVPLDLLPHHLAVDLSHKYRLCASCHGAFVNEWVTSVQVKSYKGHPAVVRRVRFCSNACWKQCLSHPESSRAPDKHLARSSKATTMDWIEAAVAAAAASESKRS